MLFKWRGIDLDDVLMAIDAEEEDVRQAMLSVEFRDGTELAPQEVDEFVNENIDILTLLHSEARKQWLEAMAETQPAQPGTTH